MIAYTLSRWGEVEHILHYRVDSHFAALIERRGGPARQAAEHIADPFAAIRACVLQLNDARYADFSFSMP